MSANEKICPTCGTEYPANERFCPRDGTALRSQSGSADLVGSIIAERYHVMKKLGEGGMGQVYLAEHVKMGRKSAVKVMNPGMVNDADAISRFNREAANASRINHPNVAGIYDFGETSDGLIYLAMEFIEGQSLTSIVEDNGALHPERAAEIVRQTGEGLQVAHDMGIVHRDLKPDNIMIAKGRSGSDLVKVVDFGIAKAAGAENQKVTKTGLVVGTPEYMSPEQLAGDKLDGRSDIYSLGLVAFNVFTGKLPFQADSAQESMIMRLTDEPKTLADVKPDVAWPADVQRVMRKALERRREDRYDSAAKFGQELWDAVNRMPKQALAGATQLVGAMDGATAVMTPPPPTRVDASAAAMPVSAPPTTVAPAVPAKSRMPIYAGGGAAALGLAVLLTIYGAKALDKSGGTVKTDSTKGVPSVTAPSLGGTQTSPPPASGGTPARQAGNTTSPQMPGGNSSGTENVNVSARLPGLLDESADSAKANRVLSEVERLRKYAASSSDNIGLSLAKANALAMLGNDKASCLIIDTIKDRGATTPWAEKISAMVTSCAQQ